MINPDLLRERERITIITEQAGLIREKYGREPEHFSIDEDTGLVWADFGDGTWRR